MNIYDVLISVLGREKDVLSMQKKFKVFWEMHKTIKTEKIIEKEESIENILVILEKITNFNFKVNHNINGEKVGTVAAIDNEVTKDMKRMSLLLVELSFNYIQELRNNEMMLSKVSNQLLRMALHDYTSQEVCDLIEKRKDVLLVDNDLLNNFWWLNLKMDKLDKFSDVLVKVLTLNDMISVLEASQITDKKTKNGEFVNVGYFWFYTLFLISKENNPISFKDYEKLLSTIESSSTRMPSQTDNLFNIVYNTMNNFKEKLEGNTIKNIKLVPLPAENLKAMFFIFSKNEYSKKEVLSVVEYLISKNFIKTDVYEKFLEMNKIINDELIVNYTIKKIENFSETLSYLKQLNVNLTTEDFVSLALSVDNEKSVEVILNFANKQSLESEMVNSVAGRGKRLKVLNYFISIYNGQELTKIYLVNIMTSLRNKL